MASTVTVTGSAGAGQVVTALVINDVQSYQVEPSKGLLNVTDSSGRVQTYDISGATTMTVTISSGAQAVVIS